MLISFPIAFFVATLVCDLNGQPCVDRRYTLASWGRRVLNGAPVV
ncbi:hypothetical protein [Mesorhizobium sp. WSM4304]